MKTLAVIGLLFFDPLLALGGGASVLVTVENPSDFGRTNETIALSLADLGERLKGGDGALAVTEASSGKVLLSQVTGNELLFQSDFKPMERREFVVRKSGRSAATSQSLVDGRFELPREDYAWENDRIAFRMYGPALAKDVNNGIDVWCKSVRYLVVDKWYTASATAGKDTYHADHGEGADFFSVGKTLGAGGSGIWWKGAVIQPGVFSTQRTISNGPVRVTFELTYPNWNIDGRTFTERKRISLDAGQNLNRVDITFEGLDARDSLDIACGLVKRANAAISTDQKSCSMSLWGPTNSDSVNGFLGTGVVLLPSAFLRFAEEKDQYVVIGRAGDGSRFTYYTGAGWTKSGDFAHAEGWASYLAGFAHAVDMPLKVSLATR